MSVKVDIKQLLEAGVHFGHKTSRWHPKMAPYIHSKRQDSHIIDLTKTVEGLEKALPAITKAVEGGRKVLFVGTKKQVKEAVREAAQSVNQPYVVERWVGGMLTNFSTIKKRIERMKELERMDADGTLDSDYTKKEAAEFRKELSKLSKNLSGIRDMEKAPDAIYVVDVKMEELPVREAHLLGIPVFAMIDTNVDPDLITYPIPANDDAIRSVKLITSVIANAIVEGNQGHEHVEPQSEEVNVEEGSVE